MMLKKGKFASCDSCERTENLLDIVLDSEITMSLCGECRVKMVSLLVV